MEADALNGGVGLLHMQHAQSGAPGQFRLGFNTEFFSAGFLCTTTYPCPPLTAGGPRITSDTMNHVGGDAQPQRQRHGWLEAYASTAPTPTRTTPTARRSCRSSATPTSASSSTTAWPRRSTSASPASSTSSTARARSASTARGRARSSASSSPPTSAAREPRPAALQPQRHLHARQHGRRAHRHESRRCGDSVYAHRALRPRGQPGRPLRLRHRRRDLPPRRAHPPVREYGHPHPNQPAGLRVQAATTRAPTSASRTTRSPRSKLTLGARFFPGRSGFSLLAAFDIGVTGVEQLHRGGGAAGPVDGLHRRRLGHRYAGPPAGREDQGRREERRGRPSATSRASSTRRTRTRGVPNAIVAYDDHPEITAHGGRPRRALRRRRGSRRSVQVRRARRRLQGRRLRDANRRRRARTCSSTARSSRCRSSARSPAT